MGATFPLMMAYVRERDSQNTKSFSFLYLANVLGAMSGTFLTAIVLVELLGFHHTLWVAAAGQFHHRRHRRLAGPATGGASLLRRGCGTKDGSIEKPGGNRRWHQTPADQMDFVFDGICGDGHGGGLDPRVYAGFENAGVFLCVDCFHLSGRHVSRFLEVSPRSQKKFTVADGQIDLPLVVAVFLPVLAGDPRFVTMNWEGNIDRYQRDYCAGQHLPVLRRSGISDAKFD